MSSIINYRVRNKYLAYSGEHRLVARPLRYTLIETDDFLEMAADHADVSRATLISSFYAVEQTLATLLCSGHSVRLGVLGTFRFSFSCRTKTAGQQVTDKDVTMRRVIFTPGKGIRRQLRDIRFVNVDAAGAVEDGLS